MVLKVSDLGSLLFQVFPDFELQSLIISLEASHLLQAGDQLVIQVLHGLLFPWMPPMPARPLAILVARPLQPLSFY